MLDFNNGADVVSGAQKFILPVPKFKDGGEPLVYPKGATDANGGSLAAAAPLRDLRDLDDEHRGEKHHEYAFPSRPTIFLCSCK